MACLGLRLHDFFHRLAEQLSTKWERSYSKVIGWAQSRLSFALLWATILCVRVCDQDGDLWALQMEHLFLNLTDILIVVSCLLF